MKLVFLLFIVVITSFLIEDTQEKIDWLGEKQKPGFINVTSYGSRIFYWLFDSHKEASKDPLVIWLQGGPGSASTFGLFDENGPYVIDPETLKLKKRQYFWNDEYNVVFVD